MTRRALAVRFTLIVATLTTIATSAPEDYVVLDVAGQTVGDGATRISVLASRAAVNHADRVTLELEITSAGGSAPATLTVTADDTRYSPEQLSIGPVPVRVFYDLTALCARDRDCDVGATVEIAGAGALVEITATGSVEREGDGALLFPENRAFPPEATVEIRFQP
jgi:hypothetical protein